MWESWKHHANFSEGFRWLILDNMLIADQVSLVCLLNGVPFLWRYFILLYRRWHPDPIRLQDFMECHWLLGFVVTSQVDPVLIWSVFRLCQGLWMIFIVGYSPVWRASSNVFLSDREEMNVRSWDILLIPSGCTCWIRTNMSNKTVGIDGNRSSAVDWSNMFAGLLFIGTQKVAPASCSRKKESDLSLHFEHGSRGLGIPEELGTRTKKDVRLPSVSHLPHSHKLRYAICIRTSVAICWHIRTSVAIFWHIRTSCDMLSWHLLGHVCKSFCQCLSLRVDFQCPLNCSHYLWVGVVW